MGFLELEVLGRMKAVDEAGEFREVPIEAVDCALLVPGESVRQVMYDRVERNYQVKREEIPVMLETLHKALGELSDAGAKVLQKLIAKNR